MLGATIGDVLLGRKIGKRAMLLGAVGQSTPDIDFMSSFWNDTPTSLLAHRGFTHSLLFDLVLTFLFALWAVYYYRLKEIAFAYWVLFFGLQISIHLFIDLFNGYGMGLFEPLNHERFSFDALYVIDPFFSFWPAISFVVLLLLKSGGARRILWQRFGIVSCSLYLVYCSLNKVRIDSDVQRFLKSQNILYKEYLTTPTPLNNWLWFVVVKTDSGFYIAYHSVLDKSSPRLNYFLQNDWMLQSLVNQHEVEQLKRFSQGFYTVERWNDTLVFNDLRFGQIVGWYDPQQRFVFHYYLGKGNSNKLVVQRGRFANRNQTTVKSLIRRIGVK